MPAVFVRRQWYAADLGARSCLASVLQLAHLQFHSSLALLQTSLLLRGGMPERKMAKALTA